MKVDYLGLSGLDELLSLWLSLKDEDRKYLSPWTEKQFYEELDKKQVLAAHDAGILIGVLVFGWAPANPLECEILQIFVDKQKRRHGVSRLLVSELDRMLGCNKIYLEVHENNLCAKSFYENLGFEKIGVRKKYYSQNFDAHVYCLQNKS